MPQRKPPMRTDCPWQRVIFLPVFSLLIDLLKGLRFAATSLFVGGLPAASQVRGGVYSLTKRFHANKTFTVYAGEWQRTCAFH